MSNDSERKGITERNPIFWILKGPIIGHHNNRTSLKKETKYFDIYLTNIRTKINKKFK